MEHVLCATALSALTPTTRVLGPQPNPPLKFLLGSGVRAVNFSYRCRYGNEGQPGNSPESYKLPSLRSSNLLSAVVFIDEHIPALLFPTSVYARSCLAHHPLVACVPRPRTLPTSFAALQLMGTNLASKRMRHKFHSLNQIC